MSKICLLTTTTRFEGKNTSHPSYLLWINNRGADLILILVLPSCILQIGVGVTRRTSIHRSRMHLAMPPCMLLGLTLALLDSKQHWAHVCLDFMMATTLPVVVSGRAFYHTMHIKNSFFHVFKPPSSSIGRCSLENTLLMGAKKDDKYLLCSQ